jgi:Fe-S-cluster-containing dehydrogenase component
MVTAGRQKINFVQQVSQPHGPIRHSMLLADCIGCKTCLTSCQSIVDLRAVEFVKGSGFDTGRQHRYDSFITLKCAVAGWT